MKGSIKECDAIVSILNAIIENNGWDVDTYGFGYYENGEIGTNDGDSLEDGLEWVWREFFAKNV